MLQALTVFEWPFMQSDLRKELLAMKDSDQALLKKLIDSGEINEERYHPKMKALHKKNNLRIKKIIEEYGWPTISLVGEDGSKAAWLIVQHAILDKVFMLHCLELLQSAIDQNDAEGWCFAYLKDRTLTMNNQPQIYGTQFEINEAGEVIPFPIENPDIVDKLRNELGLERIEEAAKRIKENYNL